MDELAAQEKIILISDHRIESLEISDGEDVIVIDGITPDENHRLAYSVVTQLNNHMDMNRHYDGIIHCSLMGKPEPGDIRPRTIIAKLYDRRTKKMMMKRKGQLQRSKIYLKEHLTMKNNHIFYLVHQARDYGAFAHVWTENCQVWADVREDDKLQLLSNAGYGQM